MKKNKNIQPVVNIIDEENDIDDLKYWLDKNPDERIEAVIELRKQYFQMMGINLNSKIEPVVFIIQP